MRSRTWRWMRRWADWNACAKAHGTSLALAWFGADEAVFAVYCGVHLRRVAFGRRPRRATNRARLRKYHPIHLSRRPPSRIVASARRRLPSEGAPRSGHEWAMDVERGSLVLAPAAAIPSADPLLHAN